MHENEHGKISENGGATNSVPQKRYIGFDREDDIEKAERWMREAPIGAKLISPYYPHAYVERTQEGFRLVNTKENVDFNGVPKDIVWLSVVRTFAEIRHYYETAGGL